MNVKELIEQLQKLEQDIDVMILTPNPKRAYSGELNTIQDISITIDQDTNKSICVIQRSLS